MTAIKALRDGDQRTDGGLPGGNGRLVISCVKSRGMLRKVWTFRYRGAETRGEAATRRLPCPFARRCPSEGAKSTSSRCARESVRSSPRWTSASARRKAQREKAAIGSFETLLEAYVAYLRANGKDAAHEVEKLFERHVAKPWPHLMALPRRASIAPEHIRDILARLVRSGHQAANERHFAATCTPRSSTAQGRTSIHGAPLTKGAVFRLTSNPVALIGRIGEFERTRDRVLSDAELRALCGPDTVRCGRKSGAR